MKNKNNKYENSEYENKVVWITGASSGIGRELARQLDQLGAKCILSARRENVLVEFVAQSQNPENHHVVPFDLTRIDDFDGIVEKVLQFFFFFSKVTVSSMPLLRFNASRLHRNPVQYHLQYSM